MLRVALLVSFFSSTPTSYLWRRYFIAFSSTFLSDFSPFNALPLYFSPLSLYCAVHLCRHTAARPLVLHALTERCLDVYVCVTNLGKLDLNCICTKMYYIFSQGQVNVFHVLWPSDDRSINLCYMHPMTRGCEGTWLRPITCWHITTQGPSPVISYHQSTLKYTM